MLLSHILAKNKEIISRTQRTSKKNLTFFFFGENIGKGRTIIKQIFLQSFHWGSFSFTDTFYITQLYSPPVGLELRPIKLILCDQIRVVGDIISFYLQSYLMINEISPLKIAATVRNLPWRGSHAAIMFLASNIWLVSSATERDWYCMLPRAVSGANPGMKKCKRGNGTMFTASFRKSAFSCPVKSSKNVDFQYFFPRAWQVDFILNLFNQFSMGLD